MSEPLTYPETGATLTGELPPGYRWLRVRLPVGEGDRTLREAGRAVLEWRMHRAMGVTIEADRPQAEPGCVVRVGVPLLGLRVHGRCQVVWWLREPERVGFGYGTLPGHPEHGEEAFVVSRSPDGRVWLTVTAFSRPALWWTRWAGPLVPLYQRLYARRCGRALRRLVG
ncbi:DUF1990 domain-containing protein [Streptomyces sp. NPDC005438]|uniref:DUF1990 family protein n=1 Tax=Streptomyces sp. NPDC005438 TaxID=3156880 RepID=UPI0033B60CA4